MTGAANKSTWETTSPITTSPITNCAYNATSPFNCVDVIKVIAAYRAERGEALGFNEVELTPGTRMTVAVPVGLP